jgi:23S rRNA pseudouridine1911/1915/1917 synthase
MPVDPAKPFDLTYTVDPTWDGLRLDRYVREMIPAMSRTKIQKYIAEDRITVGGTARSANWRVRTGDTVVLSCREPEEGADAGRHIPLEVLYEDADILALNKQPGLIVHPVARHRHDTLLNALYWRYRDLLPPEQEVSLANRLDKNTSGVILVTKHTAAKQRIQESFEARLPKKAYLALAEGLIEPDEGTIALPLGPARHRTDRCKIGVRTDGGGKASLTRFRVLERFPDPACPLTLVRLEPHTGRQHQLRVHMAETGHPLLADDRYGDPAGLVVTGAGGASARLGRYALHAAELRFPHPMSGETMTVTAPLAPDMQAVVDALRAGGRPARSCSSGDEPAPPGDADDDGVE